MAQDLVELLAPGGVVEGGQWLEAGDADDVDDARHRTQPGLGLAEDALHVGALQDVGAAGMSLDLAGDGLCAALVIVDAQHGGARLGERVRGCGTDPLARPHHDKSAALELEHLEVLHGHLRHPRHPL